MKKESKVAWPKTHAWNDNLRKHLLSGEPIPHDELLAAVDDKDHQKIFDLTSSQPLKKENHVIFQFAVYLQRADGRVAVFERASREQGQERITAGRSIFIANSTPDAPFDAVPKLVQHALCVGKRKRIAGFTSRGMVLNALPNKPDGRAQPTYLFAIYSHLLPEDVPLHGRFKDSPDTLVDWVKPEKLTEHMQRSGYIDQFLAKLICDDSSDNVTNPDEFGLVYSPHSFLQVQDHVPTQFDTSVEYTHGYAVFISHASQDSFCAYALYRFLMDESSRSILATLDLMDLRDGEHLTKIERLISECDGVILIITPSLLTKSAKKTVASNEDWVRKEIEMARSLNKPIIGFKLGTSERPEYLPEDLVANNKADYGDWLNEVRHLIDRVKTTFHTNQ